MHDGNLIRYILIVLLNSEEETSVGARRTVPVLRHNGLLAKDKLFSLDCERYSDNTRIFSKLTYFIVRPEEMLRTGSFASY